MKRTSSMAFATPAAKSKFKRPRSVSAKVAKISTKLNRILRAEEVKAVDTIQASTAMVTTGTIYNLSEIAIGEEVNQRDGRTVFLKDLRMQYTMTSVGGDVRVIVFRVKGSIGAPNVSVSAGIILQRNQTIPGTLVTSNHYNMQYVPNNIQILYDSCNGVAWNRSRVLGINPVAGGTAATPLVAWSDSFYVPINQTNHYNDGSAASGSDNIHVLFIGDAVTSTYRFSSRVSYTDS